MEREENSLHATLDQTWLDELFTALPIAIFCQVCDVCNLSCIFCARQSTDVRMDGILSSANFDQWIAPSLPSIEVLQLYGFGEPLLHPDFHGMVDAAKSHGVRVTTSMNGTLLSESDAERLVLIGLDQLVLSIDGCTEKTFAKLRGGASLEQVTGNIKKLNKVKTLRQSQVPELILCCVISRINLKEIPGIVRFASEHGFSQCVFQNLSVNDPAHTRESVCNTWKYRRVVRKSEKLAESLGLKFTCKKQNPAPKSIYLHPWPGDGKPKQCYYAKLNPTIEKSGAVRACPDSEVIYGNLGSNGTLMEILNGSRAREFRRGIITGRYHQGCARCPYLEDWDPHQAGNILNDVSERMTAMTSLGSESRRVLEDRIERDRKRLNEKAETLTG